MMNSAFYYYGLNKIYKSFSVDNIEHAVNAVKTLNVKGFAITMPYKVEVLDFVNEMEPRTAIVCRPLVAQRTTCWCCQMPTSTWQPTQQ